MNSITSRYHICNRSAFRFILAYTIGLSQPSFGFMQMFALVVRDFVSEHRSQRLAVWSLDKN